MRRVGSILGSVGVVGALGWLGLWAYSLRPEPGTQPCALPMQAGQLGAVCGFRNPEDLELVASLDRVLVSEEGLGGRVLALRADDPAATPRVLWPRPSSSASSRTADADGASGERGCARPGSSEHFAPHGASVLEPRRPGDPVRVAIVFHQVEDGRIRDSIQLFELEDGGDTLRWRGCVPYPERAIGNDVAWLDEDSLVATRFARADTLAELEREILRGSVGFDTGDVLVWSRERGWSTLPGSDGAIPNGVAVAPDRSAFYVADAGHRRVALFPREGGAQAIRYVPVGGAPNNLTVTPDGRVLATVATFSGDLPILCAFGGRTCRSGWAVHEIDPAEATATEILADDGTRIATATVVLEVGRLVFIGSMADDRVGIVQRR